MKLSIKDYKTVKIKNYFKASHLFFFANGISRNSLDWLLAEQGLKTIGFNYYKVLNRTTIKTLNTSIYSNIKPVINGSTFLIKPEPNKYFLKQTIFNTLNPLFFEVLSIKLNNKVYSIDSLKNIYSLEYRETKLLLYQYNLTHLKICSTFSK